MKNLKKLLVASAIATTTMSASNISVKIGYDNMKFGDISDSGASIAMVSSKANKGFAYELGYVQGDILAITKFGAIYNWKVSDNFYTGLNINAHGINFTSNNNTNSSSFIGYTYGLQGKYAINKNNNIGLSYSTGTATDNDTGVISEDLSIASIAYSYRF